MDDPKSKLTPEQARAIDSTSKAFRERLALLFKDSPDRLLLFTVLGQVPFQKSIDMTALLIGDDKIPELLRAYADTFELMHNLAKEIKR